MTSRKVAQSIGKPTASPHTQGNEALAEFHSHVTRHEPFPDGHNQAFKTVLISLHQKWWLNIYYTTTHLKRVFQQHTTSCPAPKAISYKYEKTKVRKID